MRKTVHLIIPVFLLLIANNMQAQNFTALYNFAGVTTSSGRIDPTPVPVVEGLTFSSFSASAALPLNPNAGGRFTFTGQELGATNGSNVFTGVINTSKYYEVTITPQTYYSLNLDSITFTLQRSGTGIRQYVVRSGADNFTANLVATIEPANADLEIVPTNVFQVSDLTTTALDGSKILLTGFNNITSPVTFRFYGYNAEGTGGTFSIDNVRFYGTSTLSPTAPNIVPSTNAIGFPATAVGAAGTVLSYSLTANNLSGPVTLTTASSNFTISDDAAGSFTNNLIIPQSSVSSSKTIFVKFQPGSAGSFTDTIVHTSPTAMVKKVALAGDGIDAANLAFNFNSCLNGGIPGSGFTTYSVTGAQVWTCTTFGRNTSNGVNISGFSGTAQDNEDWLISPALPLAAVNLPVLRFWSRGEFSGPVLELLISTNYAGSGDPGLATWTNLNATFPPLTNTWTITDGIDLTPYKSYPNVYIAFRYKSSLEDGAARWSVDDVDITNRTNLVSTSIDAVNFGETAVGNFSEAKRITVRAIGYGDVTITAPVNFQVSADSSNYSSALTLPAATISNPTDVFVRFAPLSRELKIEGKLRLTGTGLDSMKVQLSGTSYPKAETFDAGAYNLSFFGSNPTNNPTAEKISLQVQNIAKVFNRMKLDITGVEEVSSDIAMDSLMKKLPSHKYILSPRWSYSFDAPDPNFPAQKVGFIYDSLTAVLVEARAMFTGLYDSVRNGYPEKLPAYPGGTPQSFWASGRLPYMGTFDVTIQGVTKRVRVVVIHGKSATDVASYNRRVYDAKVLKDSLDAYYANDIVLVVGDYNDRLSGSINPSATTSPYKPFVDDVNNFTALTYPLDVAGRVSFIGGTGLIDHIIVTNELVPAYIANSTDIEDPRSYVNNYNATTASDHLPVFARFTFIAVVPVSLISFEAIRSGNEVMLQWQTSGEISSSHFIVERSADALLFTPFANVNATGNATGATYQAVDISPVTGRNFYRLKMVDRDGKFAYSSVVSVLFEAREDHRTVLYPNPVSTTVSLSNNNPSTTYQARLVNATGVVRFIFKGSLYQVNEQLKQQLNALKPGLYMLQLNAGRYLENLKFIKK